MSFPRATVAKVLTAYFFSGAAALGYQILWARWLGLQFGMSNVGVLVAVFAFLLGLGLGSALGLRWPLRRRAALQFFGGVELAVAVYMLLLPWGFRILSPWWGEWAPLFAPLAWWGLEAGVASVVLTLPSIALGAAFAVLVRAWRDEGADLGRLYGWNTLGGVLGALLPLLWLPWLGWQGAMWAMAALGLLAGGLGVWAASGLPEEDSRPRRDFAGVSVPRSWVWLYGGVGLGAIMLEIAWARLFGLVFLRTEYVMAVILAAYLLGVGLGSLVARRLPLRSALTWVPLLAAFSALASLALLPWLGAWVERWSFGSLAEAVLLQAGVLLLVTLPTTLALGLWFPLLARWSGQAAEAGPRLYAANSVGGALGALLAGLVVVPAWGTAAALVCGVGVLLAAGVWLNRSPRLAWAVVALLVLAPWLWRMPEPKALLPQSYRGTETLYSFEDAVSITHVVARGDGQRLLLSDLQRMDASTEPDAVAGQRNQVRLALLFHPQPRRVLLLGLGTGISASAALALPQVSVTAVELSRGAITAAERFFSEVNLGVSGRIDVVHDDARHFLLANVERYDVIVGDLFHPDLVGRSALLSVQQFQRARARLAPGGLFVQWLTLNQFDLESLQVVLRSFSRVFPEGGLFLDGFRLALVGGVGEWRPAEAVLGHRRGLEPARFAFLSGGEGAWTWLGRFWGPVAGLPDGPVQDEWLPRIEYALPRARYAGEIDVAANVGWLLARRPSAEAAARWLGLGEKAEGRFRQVYAAAALGLQGFLAALRGDPQSDRWLRMAYEANPDDRWVAGAFAQRLMETLPQARVQGMDEEHALERILAVRADFLPALRRAHQLARERGEAEKAARLAAQIRALSPYERVEEVGHVGGRTPVLN